MDPVSRRLQGTGAVVMIVLTLWGGVVGGTPTPLLPGKTTGTAHLKVAAARLGGNAVHGGLSCYCQRKRRRATSVPRRTMDPDTLTWPVWLRELALVDGSLKLKWNASRGGELQLLARGSEGEV